MSKIFAIALNTFKEAIRNRILYILLFFALLMIAGSWVISSLAIFGQEKFIRDFGIAGINLVSVAIAVLVGIGLVYNDLDKKTIYTIVSKPISRWQFLVGKYFGLLLTVGLNIVIMTFFFLLIIYFRSYLTDDAILSSFDGNYPTGGQLFFYYITSFFQAIFEALLSLITLGFYGTEGVTNGVVATSLLTLLEMAVLTSFAVLFSSFSSPTISAFMTVVVFIIGRLNEDLYLLADLLVRRAGGVEGLSASQTVTYYFSVGAAHVSPNLAIFDQREQVSQFQPVEISAYSVAYGLVYAASMLFVATIIFNRRNFK